MILFVTLVSFLFEYMIMLIKPKNPLRELKHTNAHGVNGLIFLLNELEIPFELLAHLVFGLDQASDLLVQVFDFLFILIELVLDTGDSDKTAADVLELGFAHLWV